MLTAACTLHPGREASADCRACGLPFCRECVTEADGAVYCVRCLAARAPAPAAAAGWAPAVRAALWAALGLAVLYAAFARLIAWEVARSAR